MPQGEPLIQFSRPSLGGAPPPPPVFSTNLSIVGGTTFQIGAQLVNPQFNASYSPAGTEISAVLSNNNNADTENILGLPNPVTFNTLITGGQTVVPNGSVVFTLNASDGVNNDSDTVTVNFRPLTIFGTDVDPNLIFGGQVAVDGLIGGPNGSAQLDNNRQGSFNFDNNPTSRFVYYSFPTIFGPASPLDFQVGPFPGGFQFEGAYNRTSATTQAVVLSYDLWRSVNPLDTSISGPQALVVS